MAYKSGHWHAHSDDVAQEGFAALVVAAGRFDPDRGVPFYAYGMMRAVGAMKDYIRVQTGIRRKHRFQIVSLEGVNTFRLAEGMADDSWAVDPEARAMMKAEAEQIEKAILGLEPRRRAVVQARCTGKTLRQIAAEHGISVTRTAELFWDAGRKIRHELTKTHVEH